MKDTPLVSIVTPFLNEQRFIAEAIESVLAQSYPHWELLLVDDGSDDRSTDIAKRYAQNHGPRIRYLAHAQHANRGKSVSRNLGIAAARGSYLALLDADDIFLPHKLEHQLSVLRSLPQCAMVYGPTRYWYGWTGREKDRAKDKVQPVAAEDGIAHPPPLLLSQYLRNPGSVPCTCALLIETGAVSRIGGFDEAIADLYEDQVFISKLCLHETIVVDGTCCDQYRQHPDSTSAAAVDSGAYHPYLPNAARGAYLRWLERYIGETGTADTALLKAFNHATRPYRYPRLYRVLGPLNYLSPWANAWLARLSRRPKLSKS